MELATSKAGHDRGSVYFVSGREDDILYLVNGTTKPFDRPKKKKEKHVQIIRRLPEEVLQIYAEEAPLTDQTVRKLLKRYAAIIRKEAAQTESGTEAETQ